MQAEILAVIAILPASLPGPDFDTVPGTGNENDIPFTVIELYPPVESAVNNELVGAASSKRAMEA